MRTYIHFIFVCISAIAYLCAPYSYSQTFSIFILLLYLSQWFIFYKKYVRVLGVFCFTNIYCFSFLICNFIYPIFVHPYFPLGFVVHNFNEDYILKGVSLAQLGSGCFLGGQDYYLSKKKMLSIDNLNIDIPSNKLFDNFSSLLLYGYTLLIFIVSSLDYNSYNAFLDNYLTLISIVLIFITISLLNRANKSYLKEDSALIFIKKNFLFFLGLLICMVGLIKIGDRGPIIQLGFIYLTIHTLFVNKLKLKQVLLLVFFGVLLMVFIRNTRIEGQHKISMEYRGAKYGVELPFVLDINTDLIGNARCMYLGLELVDSNGFLYGRSFIKPVLSPIPFLPTIVSLSLFNTSPAELSTGTILTKETEYMLGREIEGVGTNNIVDLYMNFGVVGVVVLMVSLGYFVGIVSIKKNYNFYYLLCYCILMSLSVYMPRSTIYEFVRPVAWGIVIIYLRNSSCNIVRSHQ
jgi:hypothetical protein